MSAEVPLGSEPKDQRVDVRLWNIMQDVCLQARILKETHERAHKALKQIEKPKSQDDRDNNAERDVLLGTGGAPWMGLAKDLGRITAHGHQHIKDNEISVSTEELITRATVKNSLRILVDSMFVLARKNELMRPTTIKKGSSGEPRYYGRHTRSALYNAFNALAEWDSYAAEQAASNLITRVSDRHYVPPKNSLALPAPSVPSQLSPRKGLD